MSQFHDRVTGRSPWKFIRFALFTTIIVSAVFLHSRSLLGQNQPLNVSQTNGWHTAVTFPNNKTATIYQLTETEIETAVPVGAVNGNIFIDTVNGTSNGAGFELGSNFVPTAANEADTWQTTFSGVLSTNTTWNTDMLITGDVVVPAGVTLTIDSGTTIFASADSDDQNSGEWTDKTELIVFGTLQVNGSESAPVYFTSNATNKTVGNWGGIQIREGSTTSELANCMVRYANVGIKITSVDVSGGGDAWALIQNCSIQHNEIGIGMWAKPKWSDGTDINVGAEILNNFVANNVEAGISLRNWSGYKNALTNPNLVNNTIEQNGMGIYIWTGSWWLGDVTERTTIKNNNIHNNETYGVFIEAIGSGDTSGSDTDAKPIIEHNLVSSNHTDIYLSFDPQGTDGLQDFQPTVRFNTIADASFGIIISETEPYDTYMPTIEQNVFMGFDDPSSYSVANESSRTIYVNNSYWGSSSEEWDAGIPTDSIMGTVYHSSTVDSNSPPLITMLSPGKGESGDSIIIHGANFGTFPQIFIPLILNQVVFNMEPIFIGNVIPVRDVQTVHETFYSTTIQIPQDLPSTGNFYLSAQPDAISPVLVDDEIIIKVNGSIVYTHDFSAGGLPQFATLIIPRPLMEQMSGQTAVIEYRDVYGNVVTASEMWLIWVP